MTLTGAVSLSIYITILANLSLLIKSLFIVEYVKAHKDSVKIEKDIDRSLNNFDVCQHYSKSTK